MALQRGTWSFSLLGATFLAALCHTYLAGLGLVLLAVYGLATLNVYILLPAIAYYIWIYLQTVEYDGTGRWEWWCGLRAWSAVADYFPMKLVLTSELNPEKRYIFGMHPHGILTFAASLMLTDASTFRKKYPAMSLRGLAASSLFVVPMLREAFLWTGWVEASSRTANRMLVQKNHSIIIILGGVREVLESEPNKMTLILQRRKGFVKLSLSTGAELVPCLAFGQNEVYTQIGFLKGLRKWLAKRTHMSPTLFWGRWFTFLPYQKPINLVIGKPIPVAKTPNPTTQQIEELHSQYIAAIKALYHEHAATYGSPDVKLVVL